MKKVSFLVAILAVLIGFTSCSKDVEKCWKVDIEVKVGLLGTSATTYLWATENDVEFEIERLTREYKDAENVEVTIKKSVTKIDTEEDCYEKNIH